MTSVALFTGAAVQSIGRHLSRAFARPTLDEFSAIRAAARDNFLPSALLLPGQRRGRSVAVRITAKRATKRESENTAGYVIPGAAGACVADDVVDVEPRLRCTDQQRSTMLWIRVGPTFAD